MRRRIVTLFFLTLCIGLSTPSFASRNSTAVIYLPLVQKTRVPQLLPESSLGVKIPVQGATAFFEGQLFNSTGELSLWIPPNTPTVRGIFFSNGTPIRPNPSDPDWRNEVAQNRELAARQLVSLWDFAYLSGTNWNDSNRSSYDQQEQLMQSALNEFAAATGHAEISSAPIAYMGGSRFAGFGPKFAQQHPERAIGYAIYVSGSSAVAPSVPGLMIVGERDNGAQTITNNFLPNRAQGALLAPALMWKVDHKCDRCGDLAWPFLDAVIRMRLPSAPGQPLLPLTEQSGWLGNISDWNTIAPYAQYSGDKRAAAWFPNEMLAQLWRGFMLPDPPLATIKWPTQTYSWSNGFTQQPAPRFGSQLRDLNAHTPLSLTATFSLVQTGEFHFFDGNRDLGAATLAADGKSATLSNVMLSQGMHSFTVRSGPYTFAWPAGLMLLP